MTKQKNAPQILPREEWPYEVPENWVWTRMGDIAQTISKGTTPTGGKAAYKNKGIPFLRVENIQEDGTISHENIQFISNEIHLGELKRSILHENDVLVSIAGTLAKTAIVSSNDIPMNTNQAIAFIRLKEFMQKQSKFVQFLISNPMMQDILLKQTKVTAIPNLTLQSLNKSAIPLPPLPEQQRIVARIESLFAKLDAAAEKIRAVLDQFPIRKAATLHKAFTGELTEKWREENGVGMNSWKEKTLGDILTVSSGNALTAKNMGNGRFPVYGGNGITGYHNKSNVDKETIVIGRVGFYCGSVHYVDKPAWITDNALIVSFDKNNIAPLFLTYLLNYLNLRQNESSTAQPVISGKKIYPINIYIPENYNEQQELVRRLDAILAREQKAKEIAENLLEHIDLTKKSILARAFRGKLGTNNPKEESAEGWLRDETA